jgi:hypothetical protein
MVLLPYLAHQDLMRNALAGALATDPVIRERRSS